MSEESLAETTKKYLNKLDRLDRELSEACQSLASDTTENSGREFLSAEMETPPSRSDESKQVRTGIETIQNAFRSIRAEVVKLAGLSGIQLAEDSSIESSLSSTLSQLAVDMAKHSIIKVATVCQDNRPPIDT